MQNIYHKETTKRTAEARHRLITYTQIVTYFIAFYLYNALHTIARTLYTLWIERGAKRDDRN